MAKSGTCAVQLIVFEPALAFLVLAAARVLDENGVPEPGLVGAPGVSV